MDQSEIAIECVEGPLGRNVAADAKPVGEAEYSCGSAAWADLKRTRAEGESYLPAALGANGEAPIGIKKRGKGSAASTSTSSQPPNLVCLPYRNAHFQSGRLKILPFGDGFISYKTSDGTIPVNVKL